MTPIPLIQGSALTASLVTYYTVPSGDPKTKAVQLTGVRLVNTDTVARTVTLHVIPAGGTASVANTRLKTFIVESASLGDPPAFFVFDDVLLPGGFIQALASAPNVVAISATGVSFP